MAADASSLRLENPNIPIAATLMDAPKAAARISITAQADDASSLTAVLAKLHSTGSLLALLHHATPGGKWPM